MSLYGYFKRFLIQNGSFYDILDVHLMDEMENNNSCHALHFVNLKRMLFSAAACAPANRALNKTSPGVVSFFIDCSIRDFFFYENNFPD